ncbi:RNA polymerase sigma-70 factor [Paenibacillus sp. LMG 31456]|uniref:RNA polymerase sigma-70 factor n=1 Tax=Paenibacillus foliorum TaxID=2654974 RepID=A0A972GWN8_9BACL|nr:RNA polymerase sigma-70 factor [Paenibacillus foliorum]NOU95192.1 RNA polymerase sigma-70 factor [Paenibacillus foliorum]
MELAKMYLAYKPLLISIAYRMLGSLSDAEDMVQDVFVAMERVQLGEVQHEKAYLVKMTTNRCLNLLSSSRKQREVYQGPWLPEPDIGEASESPEEQVVQEETVSYALLVVLQQLNPVERAVFLLREVLMYEYSEIADMVDKSEANCRKIYSRVKPKIQQEVGETSSSSIGIRDKVELVSSFLLASKTGDFGAFVHLLTDEAVLISDGGGKRRAAIFPITGKSRIQAFLEGIQGKNSFQGELRPTNINGEPGLLLVREDIPQLAICFRAALDHSAIQAIYFVVNPDKLKRASKA